jgi:hypothetical protein
VFVFEHGWSRFIVASLLLGMYGAVEALAGIAGWRRRPPRVRRPLWSHLLGFASMIVLYSLIGSDGGRLWGGDGNRIGIALCVLAMILRFAASSGAGPVPHPDLAARLLFFAALPLVVGAPRAWIGFTLPQLVIAAKQALQREEASQRAGPLP